MDKYPKLQVNLDLSERLHEPVSRAIEYLAGADDDPIDIAAALVKSSPARCR